MCESKNNGKNYENKYAMASKWTTEVVNTINKDIVLPFNRRNRTKTEVFMSNFYF